jgi:Na+-transporting NADH:ubiquinone oxidoreductase subunit C
MNKKLKTSLKTLWFMLICSVVCVGGISTAYIATQDKIRINQEMVKYKAVLSAAGLKIPATPEKVEKTYKNNVEEVKGKDGRIKYFKLKDGRYAINCTGIGLWGPIEAVVGVDSSLNKIEGIAFTSQNETPGLGGRIEESWFKDQFRGKLVPLKIAPQGEKPTEHEFDAITGATITSSGVRDMINKTVKDAPEIIK